MFDRSPQHQVIGAGAPETGQRRCELVNRLGRFPQQNRSRDRSPRRPDQHHKSPTLADQVLVHIGEEPKWLWRQTMPSPGAGLQVVKLSDCFEVGADLNVQVPFQRLPNRSSCAVPKLRKQEARIGFQPKAVAEKRRRRQRPKFGQRLSPAKF
jgi:hypothetical protein